MREFSEMRTSVGCRDVDEAVARVRLPLALLAMTTVVAATAASGGGAANQAAQEDRWCRTKSAAWVGRVITAAAYGKIACSGVAYVVGDRGRDLYVWATSARGPVRYPGRQLRIAGVIVQYDHVRATWRGPPRNVWVEAGPTTARLW